MKNPSNENAPQQKQSSSEVSHGRDTVISAVRHVGKTLESDPKYLSLSERGGASPEAQVAADLSEAQQSGYEATRELRGPIAEPEPLKTRLPGDTSSDPHTDVGRDNAATVQNRGESR